MTETSTACKNCGSALTGNFCQNCGQKADIHKISIKFLVHEFFHALTHADKGIIFLIKELVYRPGYVAREYIEGKRKKYFNPLSFLVIISAIYALVVLKSGYFEELGRITASGQNSKEMPRQLALYMQESNGIFIEHGKFISLVLIVPLLTFLSWAFFRKPGYNFAENLVLNALIIGIYNIAFILIFMPAYLLVGHAKMNNNVLQIIFLGYLMTAHYQFFQNRWYFSILKTVLVFILFLFLYWVLVMSFVFVRHQL
jgi:hypothetical protein